MGDWSEQAACANAAMALFFPAPKNGAFTASLYDPARAICARCPVRLDCLEDAMNEERSRTRHGMRGGLTPAERERRSRGQRRCTICGAPFAGRRQGQCSDECRKVARAGTVARNRERVA